MRVFEYVRKRGLIATGTFLGACVLVTGAGPAAAQTKGGRKVIRLEAIKVEGRIQKPQAF